MCMGAKMANRYVGKQEVYIITAYNQINNQ